MSTQDGAGTPPGKAGEEKYAWRDLPGKNAWFGLRQAESHAAFFTPYLSPGMRLLDCGCGPGSITCGLAGIVAPGGVVGIDLYAKALDAAQSVSNVRFQAASVYELPFPDGSFDAVFSHAVLEHLAEPLKALAEM